jgi:hypothetical protein
VKPPPEYPAGPWVDLDVPDLDGLLGLCRGQPAVFDPSFRWVSLADGVALEPVPLPARAVYRPIAVVSPDGRRVAYVAPDERLAAADLDLRPFPLHGSFEEHHPIGFVGRWLVCGKRVRLHWYTDGDPPTRYTAVDSPHQKKDQSLNSNRFRWVHLDGDWALSVADLDAVLWRGAPPGEPVAVFGPGDVPPVAVLGADDEARCAVATEPDGYAVLGSDLRQRARRPGRLLGGWGGWATVLRDGLLLREHLASGERRALGREPAPVLDAVPLVGSRNVLLVGAGRVRFA